MSTTFLATPTSRSKIGIARRDITPPVGIYHPFWGAAKHQQATGVHRPLMTTVLLLEALEETDDENLQVIITIDLCLFRPPEMDELMATLSESIGVAPDNITITFSHTHSGGHINRSRAHLPGGELIAGYFETLTENVIKAFDAAKESMQPAVLTYASERCAMGQNRDYWDSEIGRHVCGFNPEQRADFPVHVVRMTKNDGNLLGTIVNYPCHPTTLAWQNTLISPDYIGALRETVEEATGQLCLFLLAPCGDIGPKHGLVGDVNVADRNGRTVAYAALSALESMPEPLTEYHYTGAVISGATLGHWEYRPHDEKRLEAAAVFRHVRWEVPLAYRVGVPSVSHTKEELNRLLDEAADAEKQKDAGRARDLTALVERKRRLLERIEPLPAGQRYPYPIDVRQIGDAFFISVEGEPYYALQQSLCQRFPDVPLIFITLANGSLASYIPRQEDYTKQLYQADIALLEPGALESIIAEIGSQICRWKVKVKR